MGENREVAGCGVAFDAAQSVEVGSPCDEADADGKKVSDLGELERPRRGFFAVVAGGAHEDVTGVGQLGGNHVGGDGERSGFMIGAAVLFAAQQDIARGEAVGGGEEFAVGIVKRQGNVGLGARGHQGGGAGDIPTETGDTIQVVERDAQLGFALMADFDGSTIFAQIGAFERDKQSVEVAFHRGSGI